MPHCLPSYIVVCISLQIHNKQKQKQKRNREKHLDYVWKIPWRKSDTNKGDQLKENKLKLENFWLFLRFNDFYQIYKSPLCHLVTVCYIREKHILKHGYRFVMLYLLWNQNKIRASWNKENINRKWIQGYFVNQLLGMWCCCLSIAKFWYVLKKQHTQYIHWSKWDCWYRYKNI